MQSLVFKENHINYWLCHGALLGIIRENRLLSWDNDIDFGVWADEVDKAIVIKIFTQNGFLHKLSPQHDSLEFVSNSNKNVDINFYKLTKRE